MDGLGLRRAEARHPLPRLTTASASRAAALAASASCVSLRSCGDFALTGESSDMYSITPMTASAAILAADNIIPIAPLDLVGEATGVEVAEEEAGLGSFFAAFFASSSLFLASSSLFFCSSAICFSVFFFSRFAPRLSCGGAFSSPPTGTFPTGAAPTAPPVRNVLTASTAVPPLTCGGATSILTLGDASIAPERFIRLSLRSSSFSSSKTVMREGEKSSLYPK
mmetsp:Transcript_4745/g.10941  ORF Transcript_4745/g.10941 Transcript_4745/m.10941 type:complete len:224 (-) Transcript_4745:72-743(-)